MNTSGDGDSDDDDPDEADVVDSSSNSDDPAMNSDGEGWTPEATFATDQSKSEHDFDVAANAVPADDVIDVHSNDGADAVSDVPAPAAGVSAGGTDDAIAGDPPPPPPPDSNAAAVLRASGLRRKHRHPKSFDYGIFTIKFRDDDSVFYPDRVPQWIAYCPLHSSDNVECSKSIQINQPDEETALRRLLTWCLAAKQFKNKTVSRLCFMVSYPAFLRLFSLSWKLEARQLSLFALLCTADYLLCKKLCNVI